MGRLKHGLCRTPEHESWRGMKKRCYCKTTKAYRHYGGRGITMCDRWRDSFETFLADMGEKPSPKHSIDRIDNDRNYEPSNCRWATPLEQVLNRRKNKNNKSGLVGVRFDKNQNVWIAQIRILGERKSAWCKTLQEAVDYRMKWEQARSSII